MATNKKCRTKELIEITEPKHQFNHSTIATNATKNSNRNIDNPYSNNVTTHYQDFIRKFC